MANKSLTPEMRAELSRLAILSEDEIDTSDMPEVRNWSGARRGLFAENPIQERSYDVRGLANWFIDKARGSGVKLSNMSINKLVYFAVERFLLDRNVLLTPARIEAWDHGPVFREVYQNFKDLSDQPIDRSATVFSIKHRAFVTAEIELQDDDEVLMEEVASTYLRKTAGQLRAMSHVENGPWYTVWYYRGNSNPGMEITPAIILEKALEWRTTDEEQ